MTSHAYQRCACIPYWHRHSDTILIYILTYTYWLYGLTGEELNVECVWQFEVLSVWQGQWGKERGGEWRQGHLKQPDCMCGNTDLIMPKKVKCLICVQELAGNDNISSMLRHLHSKHPGAAPNPAAAATGVTGLGKYICQLPRNIFWKDRLIFKC